MYIGTIKLDRDSAPAALADRLRALRGVAGVSVTRDGAAFTSVPLGALAKNDPLLMFAGGRIRFDVPQRRARCWLDVRRRLLLAATAVILAIALIALARSGNVRYAATIFAFIWCWLVLANLLIAMARFRSTVRRAMSPSGSQAR